VCVRERERDFEKMKKKRKQSMIPLNTNPSRGNAIMTEKTRAKKIPSLLRAVYGRNVYTVHDSILKISEIFQCSSKLLMKRARAQKRDSVQYRVGVLEKSFVVIPEYVINVSDAVKQKVNEMIDRDRDENTSSQMNVVGRQTAHERAETVQRKFFEARQKPNNALCFGLTRYARREERNCVNSAEAFVTSTNWGMLWDRLGDEISEWIMLHASAFASLNSSSEMIVNAGLNDADNTNTNATTNKNNCWRKEDRLVQILGKPITSEHAVFKASLNRMNTSLSVVRRNSLNQATTSGPQQGAPAAATTFSLNKKVLSARRIKKIKRRKKRRKELKKAKTFNNNNNNSDKKENEEGPPPIFIVSQSQKSTQGNEENTQEEDEATPIISTQEEDGDDDWCIPETPQSSDNDDVQATPMDDANDSPQNKKREREAKKKMSRAPSWVRRKLAKARVAAVTVAKSEEQLQPTQELSLGEEEKWAMLANYAEKIKLRKLERLALEKENNDNKNRIDAEAKLAKAKAQTKSNKTKGRKRNPIANHARNVILDRSSALFCSTFSKRPGFPAKHILRNSGVGVNASRKVYEDIFGAKQRKTKTPLQQQQQQQDPRLMTSQAPSSYMSSEQDIIPTQLLHSQKSKRMTIRISKSHRQNVLPLLRRMLRRAKKCNFAKLLELHCPLKMADWRNSDTASLVKLNSSPKNVSSFVWAIMRAVLPWQFLGSKTTTKRRLREFVSRIVSLRRIEKCTLYEAMIGVKTSDYTFLDNVDYRRRSKKKDGSGSSAVLLKKGGIVVFEARKRKVEKLILWIVTRIVFPVIRSHFFVTDTDHERQKMYYYRKGVWSRIVRAKNKDFVTSGRYEKLSKNDCENTLSRHSLGFSRVRWKPKKQDVRPIAMLGQPASMRLKWKKRDAGGNRKTIKFEFDPVNDRLYTISDILDHEIRADETLMGNFVSDYDETMKIYSPFAERWRKKHGLLDDIDESKKKKNNTETKEDKEERRVLPKIYFVCADIKAAFDSIPTEKLETVISMLFKKQEYAMLKYRTQSVLGNRYATKKIAFATEDVNDNGIDIINKDSLTNNNSSNENNSEGHASENKKLPGPIFSPNESDVGRRTLVKSLPPGSVSIDLGKTRTAYRQQALNTLHEHLGNTLVKSHGSLYRQKIGIPQGSILSTKLCALFYAHMEQTQSMAEFETEINKGTPRKKKVINEGYGDGVFMRWTDDLLFVTDNEARAKKFLNTLLDGIAEYGVEINPLKTKINFDHPERDLEKNVTKMDGCEFIPWCGLLFDCKTLEVRADYSKYLNVWLRETINLPSSHVAWKYLSNKTRSYLNHKLCALLYDPRVNSPDTCATNMYQALLLTAAKTTCYVKAVEKVPGMTKCSFALLKNAIESAISYSRTGIKKRLTDRNLPTQHIPTQTDARALGLLAFKKFLDQRKTTTVKKKKEKKKKNNNDDDDDDDANSSSSASATLSPWLSSELSRTKTLAIAHKKLHSILCNSSSVFDSLRV
jgi:telomerase reverse transcriptase